MTAQGSARDELRAVVGKLRQHDGPWLEWTPAEQMEDGVYSMGYPMMSPELHEAMTVLYDHGIIVFDWMNWREGFELLEELTPQRAATLDRETTLKLLSAVARQERFSDGSWGELFDTGKELWLFERWLALSD